jgi:hypothetical protein
MAEKYRATWGESYEKPSTRIVDLAFFRENDLGYDDEDIDRVKALQIGETAKLDGGHHSVTRIE